jgi:hypothetical protein
MSLSALWVEAWVLDGEHVCKNEVHSQTETDTLTMTRKSWVETKETFVLPLKRKFIGFISWKEDVGEEKANFTYYVGGGATHSYLGNAQKKYKCIEDKIVITDLITGEGEQHQVWQYDSPWEPKAGTYQEKVIT